MHLFNESHDFFSKLYLWFCRALNDTENISRNESEVIFLNYIYVCVMVMCFVRHWICGAKSAVNWRNIAVLILIELSSIAVALTWW